MNEDYDMYIEYLKDNIRRTRIGTRFIFWLIFILSVLFYFYYDYSYWWAFPIMALLSCFLDEIICIKGVNGNILGLLDEKKNNTLNQEDVQNNGKNELGNNKEQLYERYQKEKDYTDRLSEWVESHNDNEISQHEYCTGICKASTFSIHGEIIQKGQNKGKIEKDYSIVFVGQVWSYFDHLPDEQEVCEFSFIIHFCHDKKQPQHYVGVYQDTYYDNIDDIQYYEGKHTISVECYEDIEELEKYKLLIASGKKLGCRVSFTACPKKIKMNGNKIDDHPFIDNIGNLSTYQIFEIKD